MLMLAFNQYTNLFLSAHMLLLLTSSGEGTSLFIYAFIYFILFERQDVPVATPRVGLMGTFRHICSFKIGILMTQRTL